MSVRRKRVRASRSGTLRRIRGWGTLDLGIWGTREIAKVASKIGGVIGVFGVRGSAEGVARTISIRIGIVKVVGRMSGRWHIRNSIISVRKIGHILRFWSNFELLLGTVFIGSV